jgi:hypothetical protein
MLWVDSFMNKFRTTMAVVGGAFIVNSLCIVLYLSGGLIFFPPLGWMAALLLYPAIHISVFVDSYLESTVLSDAVFFLLGFFQFFTAIWIVLKAICWVKRKRHSML